MRLLVRSAFLTPKKKTRRGGEVGDTERKKKICKLGMGMERNVCHLVAELIGKAATAPRRGLQ